MKAKLRLLTLVVLGLVLIGGGIWGWRVWSERRELEQIQLAAASADAGKYRDALAIIEPMAARGNPRAQTFLGMLTAEGQGVVRDPVAAVGWYRKAAEQGFPQAQTRLALAYRNGQGVPVDRAKSVELLHQAAAGFDGLAMFWLGMEAGKDDGRAAMWMYLASIQGNQSASKLVKSMSNSELSLARTLAEKCVNQHLKDC